LTGRIFFNNREFRNNLDYEYLYMNDPSENREQNNNNLNRSNNRTWRPVETTVVEYNNAAQPTTPAPDTQFIDQNGVPLKISSAVQCAAEQFIVQDKQVADNDIFELSGLVLGAHQSIFVSSDSSEILDYVSTFNIKTLLRPDSLSTHESTSSDVIKHFIGEIADNSNDYKILYLQPTSPLRTSKHIKDALNIFECTVGSSLPEIRSSSNIFSPSFNPTSTI